jgi:hypothetical protein
MIRDNENMINVFDVERILGDLPLDIIKENVKSQIEDPLVFISNQCDEVYETIDEAMEEFGHIDEYREELVEMKEDFSIFILKELDNKFNLGVDFDNIGDFELHEMAQNCYDFFVLNLNDNISNFLLNYILNNKSSLCEMFGDEYRRKDVTTMNMKKITKNRDDVLILSNLNSVINNILDLEHYPEDFMSLSVEPGEYVGSCVIDYVNSFKLAGNFVFNVLNEVKYSHNDVVDELVSTITLYLIENINVE